MKNFWLMLKIQMAHKTPKLFFHNELIMVAYKESEYQDYICVEFIYF